MSKRILFAAPTTAAVGAAMPALAQTSGMDRPGAPANNQTGVSGPAQATPVLPSTSGSGVEIVSPPQDPQYPGRPAGAQPDGRRPARRRPRRWSPRAAKPHSSEFLRQSSTAGPRAPPYLRVPADARFGDGLAFSGTGARRLRRLQPGRIVGSVACLVESTWQGRTGMLRLGERVRK